MAKSVDKKLEEAELTKQKLLAKKREINNKLKLMEQMITELKEEKNAQKEAIVLKRIRSSGINLDDVLDLLEQQIQQEPPGEPAEQEEKYHV